MKVLLFGAEADSLRPEIESRGVFELVEHAPDVVVCFGGDGTLLSAELRWPGVPKVPIRNSRRGNRCIPHPPADVVNHLAEGRLARTEYVKLACDVRRAAGGAPPDNVSAMNEINVHNGRIHSAVRFSLSLNEEAYEDGAEIIGDGFVISTPFGSTAYFKQITHGIFYSGLGVAFKNASERISHIVVPDETCVRVRITRGPAILAFDNAPNHFDLEQGDEVVVRKHDHPAVLLTWRPMTHPSDEF